MFIRNRVIAGDVTTLGGRLEPLPQACPTLYDGRLAGLEGDPIWCPACHGFGVAACVKPFRPDTADGGRQKLLDGDLCVCKCSPPPRLISHQHRYAVAFSAVEIRRALAESSGWLGYSGVMHLFGSDELPGIETQILEFIGSETGTPLSNRRVIVQAGGSTTFRTTDHKGQLKIHVAPGYPVDVHMVFESCLGAMECEVSNG